MRKTLVLTLGILAVALLACREVSYYGYKYVELDLFDGIFGVRFVGRYGSEYTEQGQETIRLGCPL